jgi:methionine-rich copper-binding protein CopC
MKKLSIILMFSLLSVPALVTAHTYVKRAVPAANSVVYESPATVVITFVNPMEPMFSKIEVFDQNGNKVSLKTKFSQKNMVMESNLKKDLSAGQYTVKWTCMSLDGHKKSGKYMFRIDQQN